MIFIASATKKAELIATNTKNVHFRIKAVQKACGIIIIQCFKIIQNLLFYITLSDITCKLCVYEFCMRNFS